jgi:hypothetical protein
MAGIPGSDGPLEAVEFEGKRPEDVLEEDCVLDYVSEHRRWLERTYNFMSEPYIRMTSLFTLSCVLGNSIASSRKSIYGSSMKPHIMLLLLGPSSVPRKSIVVKLIKNMMRDTGRVHEYPETGSIEYMYEEFNSYKSGIIAKDEFETALEQQRGKQYLADLKQAYMKMADGDMGVSGTKKGGRVSATDIAPNFISAAVTENLADALDTTDIMSGFIPRFILCHTDGKKDVNGEYVPFVDAELTKEQWDQYMRFVHTLRYISWSLNEIAGGRVIASFATDALARISTWATALEKKALTSIVAERQACYLKLVGYLYKFAIIFACSKTDIRKRIRKTDDGMVLDITVGNVEQAIAEADWYIENVLNKALSLLAMTAEDKYLAMIGRIQKKTKTGYVLKSTFMQYSHLTAFECRGVIETLVARDDIEIIQVDIVAGNNAKRKTEAYQIRDTARNRRLSNS